MNPQDIIEQLRQIAPEKDFEDLSAALTDDWKRHGAGVDTVDPILRFMEENPDIDYGIPGSLVHFVERFHGRGFEERLVESVRRKQVPTTAWMLNRLINGTKDPDASRLLIETMEQVRRNPLADQETLQQLDSFLEWQRRA
jgi:hypothetical protein